MKKCFCCPWYTTLIPVILSISFLSFFQTLFSNCFLDWHMAVCCFYGHPRSWINVFLPLFSFPFRDFGWQQRYARFCGRIVVLSILSLLLYPFLWAWTVIGTLWFKSSRDCVSHINYSSWNLGDIIMCIWI